MSRKYIKQIISQNFVYPNNSKDEYDIEIVHDINNNTVTGTVNSFTATSFTSSAINLSYNFSWNTNGAELFQMENGNYSYISVHMMSPTQVYMRPFRTVLNIESATLYTGTTTFTGTATVTPSQLGLTSFPNGNYFYEIRYIGHRDTTVFCGALSLVPASPTPTPTPTITPTNTVTPTITPTPGLSPSATPTVTPTATNTPTVTPTMTQTPAVEIYISSIQGTCSTFCTTNYLINSTTTADNNYANLTIGNTIYGLGGSSGFLAYSNVSTDTSTGPFRIAEVDSSGVVQDIQVCSGGGCIPL